MGASASFKSEELPERLTAADIRKLVDDKWDHRREAKFKGHVLNNIATGTVEDTIAVVSNIVNKPKMKEKLMKRPPFRFVKDIIYNVSKETKYMENKFATDDIQSGKAFNSKASKQIFLQQAMDAVSEQLSLRLPTQPRKVCAGVDVEQTRQFLQLFCFAAQRVEEPTVTKQQFLQEVAHHPRRICAKARWRKAFVKVRMMVRLRMSVNARFQQKKQEMMRKRRRSPNIKRNISKLWSTNSGNTLFPEDEPDPLTDSTELDVSFESLRAAKKAHAAALDTDATPPTPTPASSAAPSSDFAPRLVKNLQYILDRRKSGAAIPEGGVDVTVLAGCEAKHIIKGKADAFRKAAGKLWLCKSLIETSLFKPGLVEKFDTRGVWPAGMILASVGSVNVLNESFSKVRKAVQAAKTRPLTLHFDLALEFKRALDSAIKMDNKALAKHVKLTAQSCLPIMCRALEQNDAITVAEMKWASSAQLVYNINPKHDDWGNYCNVLFEATTAQTLQWAAHALHYMEDTLAIASQDLASNSYKPGISLNDRRIQDTTSAVVGVLSKQALWNLNDLDDSKEPNMLAIQEIARKRLESNRDTMEQRYTSCGWAETIGAAIPSRAARPRQNGVGLVPTPLHLFHDAEDSSDGDASYLCLLSLMAIAFKEPLAKVMNEVGGFKLPRTSGEIVHIKSFRKMLRLLSTEHSTHKQPMGASNTDVLSTTRCFSSVSELLAGYKHLAKIAKVLRYKAVVEVGVGSSVSLNRFLTSGATMYTTHHAIESVYCTTHSGALTHHPSCRCTNGYKEDAEPPADQPPGSRSIRVVVQFSVPSAKGSKSKIDIGTLMQMPGTSRACEEWEDSPMMVGWEDHVANAREFLHSPEVSRKPASMLVTVELMLEEHGAHRQGTHAYHLISKARNPKEMHQYFETF